MGGDHRQVQVRAARVSGRVARKGGILREAAHVLIDEELVIRAVGLALRAANVEPQVQTEESNASSLPPIPDGASNLPTLRRACRLYLFPTRVPPLPISVTRVPPLPFCCPAVAQALWAAAARQWARLERPTSAAAVLWGLPSVPAQKNLEATAAYARIYACVADDASTRELSAGPRRLADVLYRSVLQSGETGKGSSDGDDAVLERLGWAPESPPRRAARRPLRWPQG